jgi:hypothetical protein
MKKTFIYFLALCVPAVVNAAYTFNISAAYLNEQNGNPASQNGLVLLIADTLQNGFATLSDSTPVSLNGFINGPSNDDLILARWQLGASSQTNGMFSDAANNLSLQGNWNAGDPLALLWFPTLTTASNTASGGTRYGIYNNLAVANDPSLDGGARWVTQGDGTYALNFFTSSAGGSHLNSEGNASLTVAAIPEPSKVLLLGIGLGTIVVRRRRA